MDALVKQWLCRGGLYPHDKLRNILVMTLNLHGIQRVMVLVQDGSGFSYDMGHDKAAGVCWIRTCESCGRSQLVWLNGRLKWIFLED